MIQVKIDAIKIKTPRPAFRAFVETVPGQAETEAKKEERLYQQSFNTSEWKTTEDNRVKAEQQLEKDSEKRLAIILRLTDNKINDSIHDFIIKTSCDGMSSIEKANAVFSFVSTVHGLHSNLDAQNLREALWDLDRSDIRWVNYLSKFTHYYTMLYSMPQLNAEGKPKRGPVPTPKHIELPETAGLSRVKQIALWDGYRSRVEIAQKEIDDKYPDGGPTLTFQPTDTKLFTLLQQRVKEATAYPSIHSLYAQSLHEIKWTWKDLHREIKLIVENDKSIHWKKIGQSSSSNHRTISSRPTGMEADEAVAMEVAVEADAMEVDAEAAEEAAETPTRAGTCRSSIHHLHPLPKKAR